MTYEYVDETEQKVFEYLDRLRESSDVNMYGAAPFLMAEFGLERKTARGKLVKWMNTFAERHPEQD